MLHQSEWKPRRDGDLEGYGNRGRGPVWWYPMEKMYDEANRPSQKELEELKGRLKKEIDELSEDLAGANFA